MSICIVMISKIKNIVLIKYYYNVSYWLKLMDKFPSIKINILTITHKNKIITTLTLQINQSSSIQPYPIHVYIDT